MQDEEGEGMEVYEGGRRSWGMSDRAANDTLMATSVCISYTVGCT